VCIGAYSLNDLRLGQDLGLGLGLGIGVLGSRLGCGGCGIWIHRRQRGSMGGEGLSAG